MQLNNSDALLNAVENGDESMRLSTNELQNEVDAHHLLSEWDALKTVFHKSIPYATTRLLFALNTMGIGWTVSRLGKAEITAGAFSTSLQYLLVGIPQGGLCKALHKLPYAKKVVMQSNQ